MALSTVATLGCFLAVVLFAAFSPQAAFAQCDTSKYTNLASCLPAAMGTGSVTSDCCSKISAYRSSTSCLCSTLIYAKSQLSSIDLSKALAIPKSCGYSSSIPSGFTCNGITVPR